MLTPPCGIDQEQDVNLARSQTLPHERSFVSSSQIHMDQQDTQAGGTKTLLPGNAVCRSLLLSQECFI